MRVVAITTTKTSRAKGAKEYWVRDYNGDYEATLEAARTENPRKRKFYRLLTDDGWNMTAEPFTL